jgi:regulator of sigma E protease
MLDVLIFVVSTVFVLSIVVTIHELGHFWAARACGVKIDCFSLGFGPALASWRDKTGVEWRLASIPLGEIGRAHV